MPWSRQLRRGDDRRNAPPPTQTIPADSLAQVVQSLVLGTWKGYTAEGDPLDDGIVEEAPPPAVLLLLAAGAAGADDLGGSLAPLAELSAAAPASASIASLEGDAAAAVLATAEETARAADTTVAWGPGCSGRDASAAPFAPAADAVGARVEVRCAGPRPTEVTAAAEAAAAAASAEAWSARAAAGGRSWAVVYVRGWTGGRTVDSDVVGGIKLRSFDDEKDTAPVDPPLTTASSTVPRPAPFGASTVAPLCDATCLRRVRTIEGLIVAVVVGAWVTGATMMLMALAGPGRFRTPPKEKAA